MSKELKNETNIELMNKLVTDATVKDITLSDGLLDIGMLSQYSPENNYMCGIRINEQTKNKLLILLQNEAKDIFIDRLGAITTPDVMLAELEKRGLMIEAIQICTELSVESINMLREGRKYPYLIQAWRSVFQDIGEKLNNPTVVTTRQVIDGDELRSLMYNIYSKSQIDFTDPEDAIRYICKNGMVKENMARILYVGRNVLDKVLSGERMFSKTVVIRINSLLREQFKV